MLSNKQFDEGLKDFMKVNDFKKCSENLYRMKLGEDDSLEVLVVNDFVILRYETRTLDEQNLMDYTYEVSVDTVVIDTTREDLGECINKQLKQWDIFRF